MNIHFLQHVAYEGPAYLSTWLTMQQHRLCYTRLYEEHAALPALDELDALIVLGGPMGVYDDHLYPWLPAEKALIADCIGAGKKVLGICLGAQLLAVSLGARVHRAINKEIGWFPVLPTEDCKTIPWFYNCFKDAPTVFHWHGDQFDIPEGSLELLRTTANNNQAFYHTPNVIGLQFHLEMTADAVGGMLVNGAHELTNSGYVQSAESIGAGLVHLENCREMVACLLAHWLDQ